MGGIFLLGWALSLGVVLVVVLVVLAGEGWEVVSVVPRRVDICFAVGNRVSRASSTEIWKSGMGGAVLRIGVEGRWRVNVIVR